MDGIQRGNEITSVGGNTGVYDEEKKRNPENVGSAEEASVAMKPEQYAVTNSYDVDPFAANQESAREDYLEFRTMGWLNAGLIGTAEVSRFSCLCLSSSISPESIHLGKHLR